ncbi:MAG: hypothetical protein R3Y54_07930 [Eubacteriales bacterium]
MLKMKKLLSTVLSVGMITSISTTAFASEDMASDTNREIVDHVVRVNAAMGLQMTQSEIESFENSLVSSIEMKAMQRNLQEDDLYMQYLQELQQEVDLDSLSPITPRSSQDDIGDTQLPTALTGYIFFTDNDMPYNHVGIYTSIDHIVESMPKDGVRHWKVTDDEAYQSPVSGRNNDSCILKIDESYNDRSKAAGWAMNEDRIGTRYDYDFLDNKNDYYWINHGTPEWPNYVRYEESNAYNCSELVWKAYKKTLNIDLDSNGGLAVYPNNIYNSSKTTFYKSFGVTQ